MSKSSLRRQLVWPYALLVVFVSTMIGLVSYQAAEKAVETLSQRVLGDIANRISNATEQHLGGALIALHSVDPDPRSLPRAQPFSDDLEQLERRFWVASGLFMDLSNYVYFGGADGRFIGIERINKDLVELYLREPGAAQRRIYAVAAPGDRSRILRVDDYDPRIRPWYMAAAKQNKPVWSPVYNDFTSKEPTITLAKSAYGANGSIVGVLATDVTLRTLTDFLRTLNVSEHGVAFVIDGDGYIVASSGSELPFKVEQGMPVRKRIDEMQTPLIRNAYAKVLEWSNRPAGGGNAAPGEFTAVSGQFEIAARRLDAKYGLDWISVVAVPRADFMGGVTRSFVQGIFIAAFCVVVALVLGLWILNRVLSDIRMLTNAARKIGDGEPLPELNLSRSDEIGQLARTFSEMEHNLRVDKLTGVFNRASLIAQIGYLRRQLEQEPRERPSFALLFIDLDHFKTINDQYGHDAGDQVLVAVAARLKEAVRLSDVVVRYGGDEFVVLLKGVTEADDVEATASKICEAVDEPVPLAHGAARVGMSIGWALFPQDGDDVDALLKIADQRMFDTKKSRKAAR